MSAGGSDWILVRKADKEKRWTEEIVRELSGGQIRTRTISYARPTFEAEIERREIPSSAALEAGEIGTAQQGLTCRTGAGQNARTLTRYLPVGCIGDELYREQPFADYYIHSQVWYGEGPARITGISTTYSEGGD